MWIEGEVIKRGARAKQVALLPLGHHPTYSAKMQPHELPCPGEYLRLRPLQFNRCAKTKKYLFFQVAQMKEQIKTPEKELSDEDRANLSNEEFKTLVIRMLTEMIECSCKIKEEV